MTPNFPVLLATSFIPFLFAMIWFHKSLFGGDTWIKLTGMSEELAKKKPKPLMLALTFLLNLLLAFTLFSLTVHAGAVISLVGGDIEIAKSGTTAAFLAEHGMNYSTFGHGVFHGIIGCIMFVFPVLGYVTIFEHKSRKYFWVYAGYWLITLIIMGGIIGQWGWKPIV